MTRNRLSLVLTVVVVAAMWIALSPPLARAATPFFGLSPATSTSEQEIQRLAGGGARVMRFSINWNAVQAKPNGPYNWNPVDGFVLLATRYGVTPLPKLIGSPSFAASDFFRPPLDTGSAQKQWQEFVRAAVTRYGTTGPGSFWDEISNCSVVGGF